MPNDTPPPLQDLVCEICGRPYRSRRSRKGRCHSCRRYLRQYGLSRADYETMLGAYRRDGCAICGERTGRPVVDHQHGTNLARGMVCDRCNQGLGFFRDNADILGAAATYITRGNWRLNTPRLEPATPEDGARALHSDMRAHSIPRGRPFVRTS